MIYLQDLGPGWHEPTRLMGMEPIGVDHESLTVPLNKEPPLMRLTQEHYDFNAFKRMWRIYRGYVWDGASVPSVFGLTWRVTYSPFDPRVVEAALQHDAFCDYRPEGTTSKMAAELFHRTLLRCGASSWRAGIMYNAVLAGGPRW